MDSHEIMQRIANSRIVFRDSLAQSQILWDFRFLS